MVTLLAILLAACSGPALVKNNPNVIVSPNGLPAPDYNQTFDSTANYRIGTPDLLTISVFGIADLTQDVRVDSDGNILLPLIGSVLAGGKTALELQKEIAAKLSEGYVQNPQVSVFVKDYTSQRVTVGGVVKKPGVYPLTGQTSLMQVIASASGLDDAADHHGVVVFRVINGQKMAAVFDIDEIGRGAIDDPPIYSNDVVMVAESRSKDALRVIIAASTPFYYLFHTVNPNGL
jgi:polysaccharide export outer membrane protein